ncbi:MAG: formylglycine-generating enzyme family protein [Nitrospinota bacterium]|nr:formylglycine-generating enzyme family protein [Nitrospinota bacterium]
MKKFQIVIVSISFFFLLPAKPSSYSKELSKLQCGFTCHSNKKVLHRKMNDQSECTQCHSSDSVSLLAIGNVEKKSPSSIQKPKKIRYQNMALIPAGEFIMGSDDRWDDESPEFTSKTNAFLIDIYEVTNSQYKKFVDKTRYPPPVFWDRNEIPKGLEDHPVTYVNWEEASAFCRWSGKRLPTEAEWEKAARGKSGNTFPWGKAFDPAKSNNPQSESQGTKPIGSYESGKSPYGLYDMSGNVWEWTANWYLPHPGNNIPNPQYGKKNRVIKGGSWFDCLEYGCGISALSYNRGAFVPSTRNNTIGFRCTKDL